ncbi:MAG: hypothetical protein IJ991_01880, partial [Thermoguttaceae bacterium]|nr:hypothetical protein [Thermoguttaceae bacterium]
METAQIDNKPLWTRGFVALLITQFLVALNDNIVRWLIIPIGKYAAGWIGREDDIRMIGSLAFLVRSEESIYKLDAFRKWQKANGKEMTDIPGRMRRDSGSYDFCKDYVD